MHGTCTRPDGSRKVVIDVGANNGNSLRFWFNPTDSGHGMAEYARIERAEERKSYCADVFEANPHFNEQLSRLVRKYRSQGRSVRLFNGTAFSVGGGPVAFGVDPANTISSSLVRTKHVRGKTAWLSNYSISVPSVDAIKYIRSLQGYNRVVLKVDVEGYEFELLRALRHPGIVALQEPPVVCDAHDLFCELEGGVVLRNSWFE